MSNYTETHAESSRAYGKGCAGCIRAEKDIMLSFFDDDGGDFHDVFLTQADAEQFYKELGKAIESNNVNS